MIVMKFGGTSVKDVAAMDRAAGIVVERAARAPLVVVSAMAGVTSRLIESARLAGGGDLAAAVDIWSALRDQHRVILDGLEPEFDNLRTALERIAAAGKLSPAMEDLVAAHGEMFSSRIFAARLEPRLPTTHVDTRQCIVTDDRHTRANPILEEIDARANRIVGPLLGPGRAVVCGGYMASTRAGATSTLGRGGSDYTATLLGAALGAEEVQIWTDVDGMMTADPRIIPGAWTIRHISFAEASELAYFGAKVLHPSTLLPAVGKGIPVRVLNSMRPERSGTVITSAAPAGRTPIKSFACKRGLTAITVTSGRMLMAHGFLRALFEIFDRHRTSVDVVTTSEVSVSLTTDDATALEAILEELRALGAVEVESGLALICLVGANLKDRPGIAGQAFGCLEDVNVRMISQGASHINLSFVVPESDANRVLRRLHDHFFREFEPAIFERA